MKIATAQQMGELDAYTLKEEQISSIDLMERAAAAIAREIISRWDIAVPIVVFAGPGNNGGDALAVARLLIQSGYDVATYLINPSEGKQNPSHCCTFPYMEAFLTQLRIQYPASGFPHPHHVFLFLPVLQYPSLDF